MSKKKPAKQTSKRSRTQRPKMPVAGPQNYPVRFPAVPRAPEPTKNRAVTPFDEANELLGTHIPVSEEYDSLGGYVFDALGRIPRPGETIDGKDYFITVQTANARQIHNLRIQTTPHEQMDPS